MSVVRFATVIVHETDTDLYSESGRAAPALLLTPGGGHGRVAPRMWRGGAVLPSPPWREVAGVDRRTRPGLAAHAANAPRPPEPRATRRGHVHLQPGPRQARRDLQGHRNGHRGVPDERAVQVRLDHGGLRGPRRDRPHEIRHLRRAEPQLRPTVRPAARV